MAGIKDLACRVGKHDWVKISGPEEEEVWECSNCKKRKYGSSGGRGSAAEPASIPGVSISAPAPEAGGAPAAEGPALQAGTDEMTGFMDRGGAVEAIKSYLKSHKKDNYTLCMCDIDSFRKLNEEQGVKCGDIVIREVASILQTELSGLGTPCRWGGDEFLLLFPKKNGDEVYNKMFSLREKIKARVIFYEGDGVSVTMTFGLNEYDFSGDIDGFIAEAEEKLNLGKQMGGDQVIF